MKCLGVVSTIRTNRVAPFAGAWIEITNTSGTAGGYKVAPFAGAWIEMLYHCYHSDNNTVAPFAGAWIEIVDQSA